jgi:hypothetical protein
MNSDACGCGECEDCLRAALERSRAEVERLRAALGGLAWEAVKPLVNLCSNCGVCFSPVEICDRRSIRNRDDCAGRVARRALGDQPKDAVAEVCVNCIKCRRCCGACDCTGGPQTEQDCICYELTGGHQPGCYFNRPRGGRGKEGT